MIPANLVTVRFHRQTIAPNTIDTNHPQWLAVAGELLAIYRAAAGRTRADLAAEVEELVGSGVSTVVEQGLAKLLEDRCDFEMVSPRPPEEVREAAFRHGAMQRAASVAANRPFDRTAVITATAAELAIAPDAVEAALFADLRDEQRVQAFDDITPERLLERYNVALVQSILLRCTRLDIRLAGESPARFRQLFRAIRFHRLIATIHEDGANRYRITLDGPLSLFSATQKYGLQLALFLPTLLLCKDFELTADLKWGAARKDKTFTLSSAEGLVSPAKDFGVFVPKEFMLFAQSFRSTQRDWRLDDEPTPIPLADGIWVPDFALTHIATGKTVYLELFGYWRKVDLEKHATRLAAEMPGRALVAVGDGYRADDADPADFANVVRYKKTPNAEAIATAALRMLTA